MILVAAAVIRRNGRILVARRAPGQARAGLWEFPGGKVEAGETPQACLVREIWEELGIRIAVGALVAENVHHYPETTIHLLAFAATLTAGSPRLTVHDALRWLPPADLPLLALAPADLPVARRLAASPAGNDLDP